MSHESTDRRTVLRAAGVLGVGVAGAGSLAACGSSASGESAAPGARGTSATSSTGSVVKVADVPVGGGIILADELVVTQPTPGMFKAFSATCTHKQCTVSKVESGQIVCSCHGSHFDITTGAPTAESPAKAPLGSRTATVSGATITIT
ncbi:Rieske 2Fe-2S domain-containing protein [Lapillicoccus sp.]|uniref:Rieske (2Fe-2S) protein n=1 Tax=Lapillicoccus sp. TaxID=1909287 RepID=UPI00398327C6